MKQVKEHALKIIPLGGLGTIGNNMTVFEYGEEIIIVDCGIMFPTEDMPGIDFVIPDFSYVVKNKNRVKAILITHGHEDHIGAIPFLLQAIKAPLYATRLTIGLIQSRLGERPPREKPVFIEVRPGSQAQIGVFTIEFLRVNHSIIDGVALAMQTPLGVIIHTGDFKIDFAPVDGQVADLYKFAEYGEKGVLLLMSDSTNAERKGYTHSESVLSGKLSEIFSSAHGRIITATFASNIHRIQQVLDTSQKYNRKVVISGITMQKNVDIAHSLGYLNCREGLIVDIKQANRLPDRKLVVICTGTQGEPMSALSRMASNNHRHFSAGAGDTVIITASVIPGNERMVYNVINSLMKLGADVYYEQDEDIHVSGHASQEELKLMISLTRPRFFMPVHGEYRHLRAHARLAETLNIKPSRIIVAENGAVLELTKKGFSRAGTIQLNQIVVDGQDVENIESGMIKERKAMSADGILVVTAVISGGVLLRRPLVLGRGLVTAGNERVLDTIRAECEELIGKMLSDGSSVKEVNAFLKKSLAGSVYRLTRRNPLVDVQVVEV